MKENICLDCALCCDGTICTSVQVDGADNLERLAASGVHALKVDGRTTFRLPCPAVAGGCCSIYENRPATSREMNCLLRLRYDAGLVSFDDARSRIAGVKELRDRIRPQLDAFFGTPGPHAIADLFKLLKAEFDGKSSALRGRQEHAELLLDVAALRLLLRHFDPTHWNPDEASRPAASE